MPSLSLSLSDSRCDRRNCRWLIVGMCLLASPLAAETVNLTPNQDATLVEHSQGGLANGVGEYLFIGRTGQPENRRLLLAFDLVGSIPVDATITSATLRLNMSRTISGAHPSRLHPVLRSWGEGPSDALANEGTGSTSANGDATWLHSIFPDEAWDQAGGDFSSLSSATVAVAAEGTYDWVSSTMVDDIQGWLQEPSTNFGWILLGDESTSRSAKRFDSREHSTASRRPILTVSFEVANTTAGLRGDFDANGRVDFDDFFVFVVHFGSVESSDLWDPAFDLVEDGIVNTDDFFAFAATFGRTTED